MKYWGLFQKKECWIPSFRGWILLAGLMLTGGMVVFFQIHAFLAVTDRVDADLLVLEGWLPDSSYTEAIHEFKSGRYQYFITTGGPLTTGFNLSHYQNQARLAAAILRTQGVDTTKIIQVPAPDAPRNRTFACAVAVKQWLQSNGHPYQRINIFSVGPHSRRTRLLYQIALGEKHQVGIIAGNDAGYEARYWWKYSQGVRAVISETIAYLYACFLFSPGEINS